VEQEEMQRRDVFKQNLLEQIAERPSIFATQRMPGSFRPGKASDWVTILDTVSLAIGLMATSKRQDASNRAGASSVSW